MTGVRCRVASGWHCHLRAQVGETMHGFHVFPVDVDWHMRLAVIWDAKRRRPIYWVYLVRMTSRKLNYLSHRLTGHHIGHRTKMTCSFPTRIRHLSPDTLAHKHSILQYYYIRQGTYRDASWRRPTPLIDHVKPGSVSLNKTLVCVDRCDRQNGVGSSTTLRWFQRSTMMMYNDCGENISSRFDSWTV